MTEKARSCCGRLLANDCVAPARHSAIVVGAGACGLATALVLARRGWGVQVLERRRDPESPAGKRSIRASERLLTKANQALRDGTDAERALALARGLRARQWGGRLRSIVLDAHSLAFLRGLGVDTGGFPRLQSLDVSWGEGAPSLRIRYRERPGTGGPQRLDAERLVLQRDWVVQPSIAQLESSLRAAAQRTTGISLRFEAEVTIVEEDRKVVSVHFGNRSRERACAGLLVIADGGGAGSLSRRLGIARAGYARELLDVAVFAAREGDRPQGHRSTEVFGAGGMTPTGWAGMVGNGEIVTVDSRRLPGARAPSAYEFSRRRGVSADLLEPPMEADYAVDRAERFVNGARTVVAGDAAVRGTPLFGLGAQYGLLWAQLVGDLATDIEAAGDSRSTVAATHRYAAEAERIARARLEFEVPCLNVIDQTRAGTQSLTALAVSEGFLQALSVLDLDFEACGNGDGRLALELELDLRAVPSHAAGPELAAFRGLGALRVSARLALRFVDGRAEAVLTPECPLLLSTAVETMTVDNGVLALEHCGLGHWDLSVRESHIRRRATGPKRDGGRPGPETITTPLQLLRIRLPDTFVDGAMEQLRRRLASVGLLARAPLSLDLALAPGNILDLGTFRVRLRGAPRLRLTLSRGVNHAPLVRLEFLSGFAEPLGFSGFARSTPLGAARWLDRLSRLTGGASDWWVDGWAGVAGSLVRRVDFELHADGGATAVYDALLRVPFRLDAADMQRLMTDLLSSRALGALMRQYQQALTAARLSAAR